MNILFVHGWGTDVRIWYQIARRLPEHQIYFLDFGYLRCQNAKNVGDIRPNWHWIKHEFCSDHIPPIPQPYIAVGHSMGVAWLLKKLSNAFSGLISIAGFARFANSDNLPALEKMMKGLENNPVLQLKSFWRSANIQLYRQESEEFRSDTSQQEYLDVIGLLRGLEFLSHCNEFTGLNELNCRVRALASRDDKIVSEFMTNSQWTPEQLRWANTGGHGLPLSEVNWCFDKITSFIRELGHS